MTEYIITNIHTINIKYMVSSCEMGSFPPSQQLIINHLSNIANEKKKKEDLSNMLLNKELNPFTFTPCASQN